MKYMRTVFMDFDVRRGVFVRKSVSANVIALVNHEHALAKVVGNTLGDHCTVKSGRQQ